MILLLIAAPVSHVWSADVMVEALLPGAAVVQINGERKMLKAGQSHGGVTLVAADAKTATLSINGQRKVVGISQRIGTSYEEPEEQVVTIARDAMMQYQTVATINGRTVRVLVDTGANVVAMSTGHARALGVDYIAGQPSQVQTASGLESAWVVKLRSVSIGGIEVNNVTASVVDGSYPTTILLGMSYLQHVKMQENNGVLSLSRVR